MGLGGHMMWTAVARELRENYKGEYGEFKILPTSGNSVVNSEIFINNPNFTFNTDDDHFKMDLSISDTNYCIKEENRRAYHKYDKHIIEQICEFYKIDNPKLKCELYFTDDEIQTVDDLISLDNFVTIEPHSKSSYTPNNKYPFDKWQNIVNEFPSINFVQIGVENQKILNGVTDLTGKMSFREACYCIKKSLLFLGTVGGLMHGANAVGTKSIIIVTPYQHPRMACYPDNINIRVGGDNEFEKYHGLLDYNEDLYNFINTHDETEIMKAVL